jgi:sortase (surface protein transpeptidase)
LIKLRKFWIVASLLLILGACGTSPSAATQTPKSAPTPTVTLHQAHVTPTAQTACVVNKPEHLSIPGIGVNSRIEDVGIASTGDMQTPTHSLWDDTGWYATGVRPGKTGSAVIDGHLDRPGGYPAVFWNLRQLHAGDSIIVTSDKGQTFRFRVTRVAAYASNAAPVQEIFGYSSGIHLNLITCAGD